jgi:hypothetical protein
MLDMIIPKIKGFLFNPVEAFQASRGDETRAVLSYYGVLLLFCAVLLAAIELVLFILEFILLASMASTTGVSSGLSAGSALGMGFLMPVIAFFEVLICGSLLMLIFSLWTHLWVYLLGGRKGFLQTLHVVLYSMTPSLLLGWIPLIGILAFIWTICLMVFGIRELQEIGDGRAVMVVFISVVIPIIILVVLLVLAMVYLASIGGIPLSTGSYP